MGMSTTRTSNIPSQCEVFVSNDTDREFPFPVVVINVMVLLTLSGFFVKWWVEEAYKDDGGYPAEVQSILGEAKSPLQPLVTILAQHNRQAHAALKAETGTMKSLSVFMRSHPERFVVPHEWFALVGSTKEIPQYQIDALVRETEAKVLSTTEAAQWVSSVHSYRQSLPSLQAQRQGVQMMLDSRVMNVREQQE